VALQAPPMQLRKNTESLFWGLWNSMKWKWPVNDMPFYDLLEYKSDKPNNQIDLSRRYLQAKTLLTVAFPAATIFCLFYEHILLRYSWHKILVSLMQHKWFNISIHYIMLTSVATICHHMMLSQYRWSVPCAVPFIPVTVIP